MARRRDPERIASAQLHGALCRLVDLDLLPGLDETEREARRVEASAVVADRSARLVAVGGDPLGVRYVVEHGRARAEATAKGHRFSWIGPRPGFTADRSNE